MFSKIDLIHPNSSLIGIVVFDDSPDDEAIIGASIGVDETTAVVAIVTCVLQAMSESASFLRGT